MPEIDDITPETDINPDAPPAEEAPEEQVDWRESLPEELKGDSALKDIKDIEALAKSYVHAQTKIGAKGIIRPGKDGTAEDWDKFYESLGRPKTAADYENPANLTGELSEDEETFLRGEAHRLGLTKQQYAGLHRAAVERQSVAANAARLAAEEANLDAASELMRDPELGGARFDKSLKSAKAVARQFDPEGEFVAALEASGIANNLATLRFLAKVGQAMSEDEIYGTGQAAIDDYSPAEASSAISSMLNNPEEAGPLFDASHKDHAKMQAKWQKLHDQKSAAQG